VVSAAVGHQSSLSVIVGIRGRQRHESVFQSAAMELQVFEASNGACPYLEKREWHTHLFATTALEGGVYEALIDHGFRRSGRYFYRNQCPGCRECIPIRLPVESSVRSRSQKRAWKRNLDVFVDRQPAVFEQEGFLLYNRYCRWKHQSVTSAHSYQDFLVNSAVDTWMMKYFIGPTLVGIGWVDVLPFSLSSVYFAFDPDYRHRSLGVFSVLKEMELARELAKPYLHLGFWVRDCPAMAYKQQFRPHQLLIGDGIWIDGALVAPTERAV
jgi:leucyl-tRNA---protein transferase